MRAWRHIVALTCALALTACTLPDKSVGQPVSPEEYSRFDVNPISLGDPALLRHVEDSVEAGLVAAVDGQAEVVENVEAIYYSKEYLEEVAYNSQANIYFGYTLAELDKQFEGEKYVFAPDGHGKTTAKPFEDYDDTYNQIIRNIAIGSGVILLLVTVAAVTPETGAAAVVSVLVIASAKSAAIVAGSDALLSAVVAAVITGIETGDIEQALKEAGLAGSEGFMWGAIAGALAGGLAALSRLRGVLNGELTLVKAAEAQRAGYRPGAVKRMRDPREVDIYKNAGLKGGCKFRGRDDLLRTIDLSHVGADGRTNLARMKVGDAPLDPNDVAYELHHIGQKPDSPLAVLTRQEHRGAESNSILHKSGPSEVDHGTDWQKQTRSFWKDYAEQMVAGLLDACLA